MLKPEIDRFIASNAKVLVTLHISNHYQLVGLSPSRGLPQPLAVPMVAAWAD